MTIEEIMQLQEGEDQSSIINRLKLGRSQAAAETSLTTMALDPMQHEIYDHQKRPDKKVRADVEDNEIGRGNIVNVSGTGEATDAHTQFKYVPVARVALAIQKLIVNRAVAFLFGNPPSLQADPREGTREQDVLNSLQRVIQLAKTKTLNRQVARSVFEYTEAAELWYPAEQDEATDAYGFETPYKLKCKLISPELGDTLYPYFNEIGDLIAFSRDYEVVQADNTSKRYFETYTTKAHYRWTIAEGQWVLEEGYPKANTIGKIPVVYACQTKPEWVDVQGLIDRLEVLLSNFADTNDYHAAPKIFTTGSILGWAKKGESGAVIEGEDGATAQYLSWAQAPESVKLEIETLLRMIHTITQTPDISFDSVKGLNLSGTALRLLFMDAHLKVQDKAEIFDEYLQRRNSIIQAFLAQMNARDSSYVQACRTLIAEPVIQPFMIEDDTTKIANLMSATGQKAILSQRQAIQRLGWSKDVDAELAKIEAQDEAANLNQFQL